MIDFTPFLVRLESVGAAYLLGGSTAAGYTLAVWTVIGFVAVVVPDRKKRG